MGKQGTVPVSKIRENPVALRTVNRQSAEFLGLVDSIRVAGILNPPTVREKKDAETGESYFEIVDGLHRITASKDAGLVEVPVHILDMNDAQVLEAQIMGNLHSIKTPPGQYTQQLKRILNLNPLLTEAELAKKLGVSPEFIKQRLSLTKIEDQGILKLVDEGKIPLANAYTLAKLPLNEQAAFLDRAMTQKADQFVPAVTQRVKEINEARRQGQAVQGPAAFEPVAFLVKAADVKAELESGAVQKVLIKELNIKTPAEAFAMALRWCLHLDPKSVEAQKIKWEARQREAEEAKAKRKAEAAQKKQVEAEQKAKEAAVEAAKAQEALKK
jgi:ParB family chromosome partitioning protein